MGGIFLILRAIIKVKSGSEGGDGTPSQEDSGVGDSLTIGVIPCASLWEKEDGETFLGLFPPLPWLFPRSEKKRQF